MDRGYDVVDVVARSPASAVSPAQVALNWLTRRAGVSSVIVGARTEEQLVDNLGAASWTLADQELQRLNEISVPRIIYPYWHQQFSAPADSAPATSGRAPTSASHSPTPRQ